MNVNAKDTGTGQTENVVITNEKGRLSQEEIEQMLRDAETFAEADKEAKGKIDARNSFESYVYSMRNTIEDPEKLKDKLDPEDIETINEALEEAKEWLGANPDADKEEYEEQQKDLEEICNPIIKAAYEANGGPSGAGGAGGDEDYYDDDDFDHEDL